MTEHAIQNTIRNALAGECMLFRAQVGQAWTGTECIKLANGDMLIKNPRPFSTGLPAGFSDLFGLVPVTITEAMLGKTFGRFVAGEVKTLKGRATVQQLGFIAAINRAGGAADVWRSPLDAMATLSRAKGE